MWEQAKALQEGAEIVVCTPVRETDYQPVSCKENLDSTAAPNRTFNANVCLHRVV